MTLYPPYGSRGFGPMRAIKYGAADVKEYTSKKSMETLRFVQIEHIDFIDNLEEIVKIPFIDGFIFGPNDLSGSLSILGDVFDDKVTAAINRAIKILRDSGKYIGLAVGMSDDVLKYWSQFDVDMITAGADWNFIFEHSKLIFERLNRYHKNRT
jgi:2-dehydro-3-deoxyglucarate aldolase/4-hydroxy-2-oxoheptanedioate aldolase